MRLKDQLILQCQKGKSWNCYTTYSLQTTDSWASSDLCSCLAWACFFYAYFCQAQRHNPKSYPWTPSTMNSVWMPFWKAWQRDHDIWYSPITNLGFTVESKIKSRHTANEISSKRKLQNLITVRVERTCTLPAEVAVKAIWANLGIGRATQE